MMNYIQQELDRNKIELQLVQQRHIDRLNNQQDTTDTKQEIDRLNAQIDRLELQLAATY